jgi:hypothetical protein
MTMFVAGGSLNPVKHSHIIVHRAELDTILDHIDKEDSYVILCGPRQTGKTTLLYQVQSLLNDQGYGVAYLDLSGLDDLNKNSFYHLISNRIKNSLTKLLGSNSDNAINPETVNDQTSFADYLKSLSSNTPQARKIILMLDEVGGVPEDVAETFFPTLRSFFQQGREPSDDCYLYQKIIVIFAGSLDLSQLIRGHNSPVANVCKKVTLTDFSKEQIGQLVRKLNNFSDEGIEITINSVYEWCYGHPYLTQSLLKLIDESQVCRNLPFDKLPEFIDGIVNRYILCGGDPNCNHILHYLQKAGKPWQDAVFKVLHNRQLKTISYWEDLEVIGIVRRLPDFNYTIHNKVYEKILTSFFDSPTQQ